VAADRLLPWLARLAGPAYAAWRLAEVKTDRLWVRPDRKLLDLTGSGLYQSDPTRSPDHLALPDGIVEADGGSDLSGSKRHDSSR